MRVSNDWWTRETCKSKLTKVSIEEFEALIARAPAGRRIEEVIVHHTWKPRVSDYRGSVTWHGIRNYHVNERGWTDIGYHVGIAPDRSVWLLRPVKRAGGHCLGHNAHSVGVVMLGNYDKGRDDPAPVLPTTARVVAAICRRYELKASDVYFHRDFADKTCPGTGIDRGAFRELVVQAGEVIHEGEGDSAAAVRDDLGFRLFLEDGEDWVELECLPGGDHREDQGKVYLRMIDTSPSD